MVVLISIAPVESVIDVDRIRFGKVSSPAERCVPLDFRDEAFHTRAVLVFIAQAFAVTE